MEYQKILVVGGGLGIGLEITKAVLTTTSTTKVVVFGLHADPGLETLVKAHQGRILTVIGDVTSEKNRKNAVEICVKEFGGIDTFVYSAGVIGPIERIERLRIDDMKKSYDVNVFGLIGMVQLVLPHIRASSHINASGRHSSPNRAYGKVIILSSACDAAVTYNGWMTYCTSKAALTRFIQLLAHEEKDITVQGVYPKLTKTKMPEDIYEGKFKGIMADEEIELFKGWSEKGDDFVEPPEWCGQAVAKLVVGEVEGGKSGETLYYDVHVPGTKTGKGF